MQVNLTQLQLVKNFAEENVDRDWCHTHWLNKDMTVTSKGMLGRLLYYLAEKISLFNLFFTQLSLQESQEIILACLNSDQVDSKTAEKVRSNFNAIIERLNPQSSRYLQPHRLKIGLFSGEQCIKTELRSLKEKIEKTVLTPSLTDQMKVFADLFVSEQAFARFGNDLKKEIYVTQFDSQSPYSDWIIQNSRSSKINLEIKKLKEIWENIEKQIQILEENKEKIAQEWKKMFKEPMKRFSIILSLPKKLDDIETFLKQVETMQKSFDKETKEILPIYQNLYAKLEENSYSGTYSAGLGKALAYNKQQMTDFFKDYAMKHLSEGVKEIEETFAKLENYQNLLKNINFDSLTISEEEKKLYTSLPPLQIEDLLKLRQELDVQMQKIQPLKQQSDFQHRQRKAILDTLNEKHKEWLNMLRKYVQKSEERNDLEEIQKLSTDILQTQYQRIVRECNDLLTNKSKDVQTRLTDLIAEIDVEQIYRDSIEYYDFAKEEEKKLLDQLKKKAEEFDQEFGPAGSDPNEDLYQDFYAFYETKNQEIKDLYNFTSFNFDWQDFQMQTIINNRQQQAQRINQEIANSRDRLLQLLQNRVELANQQRKLYLYC